MISVVILDGVDYLHTDGVSSLFSAGGHQAGPLRALPGPVPHPARDAGLGEERPRRGVSQGQEDI